MLLNLMCHGEKTLNEDGAIPMKMELVQTSGRGPDDLDLHGISLWVS